VVPQWIANPLRRLRSFGDAGLPQAFRDKRAAAHLLPNVVLDTRPCAGRACPKAMPAPQFDRPTITSAALGSAPYGHSHSWEPMTWLRLIRESSLLLFNSCVG
jgi:hypothetical protein